MNEIYIVDGKTYEVSPNNIERFLTDFPNAVKKGKETGSTEDPTMSQKSMGSQLGDGSSDSQENVSWFDQTWLGRGIAAASTTGEATDLFLEGSNVNVETVQEFIKAKEQEAREHVPSERMQRFQKKYKEEGSTWSAFFRGVKEEPMLMAELFVQSLGTQLGTAFDAPESLAAAGAGAGVGAGVGFAAGGIGAIPGALTGAMGGLATSMETALTFGELIEEELKKEGKEFTDVNIKELLEGPKGQSIRNRSIGRGIAIGTVEAFSGGLAGKAAVATKGAVRGARKGVLASGAVGVGVEAVGGATGEVTGRLFAGQEMDPAEIGFEAITGTVTAPLNITAALATAKQPTYKLNGEDVTYDQMKDFVETADDIDVAKANIKIENDFTGIGKLATTKQNKAIVDSQIDEKITDKEDRDALVDLEAERVTAEANVKKKGIDKVPNAPEELARIQAEIDGIIGKYEGAVGVGETQVAQDVREARGEIKFQDNMEFAKKHSKLYGLKFTELTQKEIIEKFKNTENSGLSESLGGIVGNEIIINKDLAKTRVYGDNVGNHELLHGIIKASKAKITQNTINDFLNIIGKDNEAIIQKRIDENYDADYMSKNLDEYFTIFSDAIANDEVKFNDNVFTKIADVIRRMFASFGIAKVDFESGRGAYNFLKDYNKSIHKGTLSKGVKAKASDVVFEEAKESRSKLVDAINDLQQGATTKADFQKPETFNKVFEAVQSGGAINNYIRSLGMSTEKTQETIDAVTDRLINFDPAAKRKDGTTIGPKGLGEFIMANVGFGKLEAAKKLAVESEARKRTTRIDDPDVRNIPDDTPAPTTKTETKTKKTVVSSKLGVKSKVDEAIKKQLPKLNVKDLTFKKLKNLVPEITSELFGISTKKIKDLSNLSKPELQKAQMFISKNAPLLLAMLPDGTTISGTSTGVPNSLLAAFYTKTAKAKLTKTGSRAGLPVQVKNKNITPKKFLETFGIIDGKPMRDDRNTSARVLAMANLTGKMMTNQAVRENLQLSSNSEQTIKNIREGTADIMFSKSISNLGLINFKKLMNDPKNGIKNYDTFLDKMFLLSAYGKPGLIRRVDLYSFGITNDVSKDYAREKTLELGETFTIGKSKDRVYLRPDAESALGKNIKDITKAKVERYNKVGKANFNDMIDMIEKAIKDNPNDTELHSAIYLYLSSAVNDTSHPLRAGAEYLGGDITATGKIVFEHAVQSATVRDLIMETLLKNPKNFNKILKAIKKNYKLIALSKADAKSVDSATYIDENGNLIKYKNGMGAGWDIFIDNWFDRYFNTDVNTLNPSNIRLIKNNKAFAEEYGVTMSGKSPVIKSNLKKAKVLDKAISYHRSAFDKFQAQKQRGKQFVKDLKTKESFDKFQAQKQKGKEFVESILKKPKGITVLDFDDTLATTKSLVKYTTPDGKTGTLNAEEFASTYEDLQDQGYVFDFSDFNKVVKGKLAPLFNKAIKLQGKFGPENMFVLTARPPQAAKAIFDFLKANGLNIPLKNITGLGNSTSEAKALWVADKVGEGYNDFYFADDALQNVQAVKNMLDQFDVKSKVQQAKVKFSKSMNNDFNGILEEVTGIDAKKRFSDIKARKRGASKGKFRFFIPPSHEDFVGLLYNFMGKGRRGDQHRNFFEQALVRPLNRAYREIDTAKQAIANDYKALNKQFEDIKKKLRKKTPDGDFIFEDAIRVYLWNKHGYDIPGLSPTDQQNLVDIVMNDNELRSYADTINVISKQDKYVDPGTGWEGGNIKTDLIDATGRVGRAEYFTEFKENADILFSPENLNKIEAAYGADFRSALEDILHRISTGINRPKGQHATVNKFMNYLNGSVGTVMFFNVRSAILQQMSIVNYINFADNNMFAAAKAFANQKQYWADFAFIFNSDMLKQRRGGIGTDINGNDLAQAVAGSKEPSKIVISKLLELGFLPTQIGDNIAIATGGATFYRNRINKYLKDGLSKKEAEAKAFTDFQDLTQSTQQSSRPDMTSQQQASWIGKLVLNFQNITSQYNRIIKKAALDVMKGRISPPYTTKAQSNLGNLSKILYYGAIQNVIFYSLQTALFAVMFDDDNDEDQILKKRERVIQGTIDSILRGSGIYGAVASTLKNAVIKFNEQRDKGYNKDESAVLMELLNFSPVVGIKSRMIVNAEKTINYNENVISEMETFQADNPQWSAVTNYTQALTNFPANRLYQKSINMRNALDKDYTNFQRVLFFSGYTTWSLGLGDSEAVIEAKEKVKINKKNTKKRTRTRTRTRSR